MTQEEKQLLLKDLCARLPYGVKIRINNKQPNRIYTLNCYDESDYYDEGYKFDAHSDGRTKYGLKIKDFKPYLRPMSSMTEEELKEFSYTILQQPDLDAVRNWQNLSIDDLEELTKVLDWLNAHHFDYRSLIPMGLSLEAPKDMYKIN